MYSECKEYLIKKLEAAGIMSSIFTDRKNLEATYESHVGAILFGEDTLTRNGSKTRYKENGNDRKREKVFDRTISYDVIIGDYKEETVQEIFENFVTGLDKGILINGMYVSIDIGEIDWVEQGDSLLKSKLAVQMKVLFTGGIYKQYELGNIQDINVTVEKEANNG